ncbi:amidase domain-containing protein [Cryobacterium sp. PAMC25264]|uniref:amidase domain-containing protein n=1 Tax=Cryobacterium sp. PAMC25264 TaxID=2861288 RepID=UPI001C632BC7|nr:amidase domain-containing protein [Cryobacterium sp. PAMC25264]QYF73493.1 amidase domain-containing protein [Cryobacterium sp. PAMC25264]
MIVASVTAGCTVVAIVGSLVVDSGAFSAVATAPVAASTAVTTATPTPSATITVPTVIEPAQPIIRSAVVAADGTPAGPVTGGTLVTVTGTDLAAVTSASFGGNPATVVSATDDTVTLQTPAATDLTTGSVTVNLFAGTDAPVQVVGGASVSTAEGTPAGASTDGTSADHSSVAAAALTQAIEPTAGSAIAAATATDAAATIAPVTPELTFTYVPDPRITAQIDYVLAHWQVYNSSVYGAIPGNDCVNFTSQSLIARGWTMDAEWSFIGGQYSPAWASSTAFAAYLAAHPERATPLRADQRAEVKVGDIVQFDWDDSGDKDHTGIVTRVEHTATGTEIYYAGHTNNTDYRSVDESLARSGGSVSYWSVV